MVKRVLGSNVKKTPVEYVITEPHRMQNQTIFHKSCQAFYITLLGRGSSEWNNFPTVILPTSSSPVDPLWSVTTNRLVAAVRSAAAQIRGPVMWLWCRQLMETLWFWLISSLVFTGWRSNAWLPACLEISVARFPSSAYTWSLFILIWCHVR